MSTDKKISELPVANSVSASDISVLVNNGTDYQYTFAVLLQFLQANLITGANLSFGTVLPQNTTGKNGDVFVITASGSFAQKVSGTWTIVYTLPAASAADGTLLYGAGLPGSGTGKDLDSYINTLTGIFYKKASGTWSQVFSMATGPQGPRGMAGTNGTNGTDGNTILFGTSNPSNTLIGVNGNFYINTSTYKLFGPKTAGIWGDGISLLGVSIPTSGTAGQVLAKVDGTDYNTDWQDNSFANLSGSPADNTNLAAALTAKQNSLGYTAENAANKNSANGYAGLDGSGKVASAQLPSYVDDVLEFANFTALPATGETGKIYVTLDTNAEYRWSGSTYIQLVASPGSTDAVPEGSTNKYFTAARVLATLLTGIGFSSATAITATDTILSALGKLQAQVTALFKIPAGGTTGQVLAKVDGADGNTHWVDAPSGGGGSSGYTSRSFNEILTFDINFKMETTQTGDIDFVLGSDPVADVVARIIVVGDGVHNLTFPSDWYNISGQRFENTAKNIIYLEYDGTEVVYSIGKIPTPDVIAPYLLSASISNSNKNKIVLSYSELLDQTTVPATPDFAVNLSKAVTAVTLSGSLVTLTVDNPYAYGDIATVSYTPGGNPIQDLAANHAVALTALAVTNNVLPASTTLTFVGANQIPATSVPPTALSFGSGGTDTAFSVSFWVKRAATANKAICGIGSVTDTSKQNMLIQFDTSGGELLFQIFSSSGQAYISTNTTVTAGVWTHVACTYDGNKLGGGMKVYFNGSLVAVTVQSGSYPGQQAYVSDTVLAVLAGPYGYNTGSPQEPAYNYLLDQLYFWDKELTSGDVTAIYNGGALVDPSGLSIASHLTAGYEFNGALTDRGTHGYDLISTVAPTFSTDHV